MQRVGISLPDDLYELLIEEAAREDKTNSAVTRTALREYFERRGKKVSVKPVRWGGHNAKRKPQNRKPD